VNPLHSYYLKIKGYRAYGHQWIYALVWSSFFCDAIISQSLTTTVFVGKCENWKKTAVRLNPFVLWKKRHPGPQKKRFDAYKVLHKNFDINNWILNKIRRVRFGNQLLLRHNEVFVLMRFAITNFSCIFVFHNEKQVKFYNTIFIVKHDNRKKNSCYCCLCKCLCLCWLYLCLICLCRCLCCCCCCCC